MNPGCEMDLEDTKENLAAIYELGSGRRSLVLVDSRGVRWQTREAREHFVSEDAARATAAVALLVGSPISRVLGNFFLRFERHRFPTALFSDEDAAVRWLLEQSHE